MTRGAICRSLASLAFVVSFATALYAENWPEFRGPTGQGLSSATGLPVKWSATENVTWKQPVPGKGWSSPILLEGKLYLTTAVPLDEERGTAGPQSLRTLCLAADTGKTLWDTEVFQQTAPGVKIHGKNSHASPTPIANGKHLFVHFGTHGTACLDLEGKIVWKNQELKYAPVHGNGGSPVLINGLLVLSCDGGDQQFVVAMDAATGEIRWKTPREENGPKKFAFCTPLVIEVAGKPQIVSVGANSVSGFDPQDGKQIWKVRYEGYSVVPRPVYGHGLLFMSTSYDNPTFLAIRPDGTGDVTDTHVEWTMKKGAPHNPSPLLVGDELYLMSDNGIATCLDARTGRQYWQQRIGGNFSASPLYADGKIYFQSEDGEGIVIQAGTTFEELSRNPIGERTLASYAVGDKALFIRSDKHLNRIEQKQ